MVLWCVIGRDNVCDSGYLMGQHIMYAHAAYAGGVALLFFCFRHWCTMPMPRCRSQLFHVAPHRCHALLQMHR